MNDQQLWQHGLRLLRTLLNDMPHDRKKQLLELLGGYRVVKESQAAVIMSIDSKAACSDCKGQCCLNGKYRMNVFDALSAIAADKSLCPAFLQKPCCPYGDELGCKLEPAFRPVDCILFVCDILDMRMSDDNRSNLNGYESALKDCLQKASRLLEMQVNTPLLLWAEKTQ